jgi:hypothetical protein
MGNVSMIVTIPGIDITNEPPNNTQFIITVGTDAKDLAGNSLQTPYYLLQNKG